MGVVAAHWEHLGPVHPALPQHTSLDFRSKNSDAEGIPYSIFDVFSFQFSYLKAGHDDRWFVRLRLMNRLRGNSMWRELKFKSV